MFAAASAAARAKTPGWKVQDEPENHRVEKENHLPNLFHGCNHSWTFFSILGPYHPQRRTKVCFQLDSHKIQGVITFSAPKQMFGENPSKLTWMIHVADPNGDFLT